MRIFSFMDCFSIIGLAVGVIAWDDCVGIYCVAVALRVNNMDDVLVGLYAMVFKFRVLFVLKLRLLRAFVSC